MATVTRENIGTLHDKISIKVGKDDYMPSFEKTLKQQAKQANIPGFRKGMVPMGMVKKMYGQSIFTDEVLRAAGTQLEEYMKKERMAIFAQPMILPDERQARLDMNAADDVQFSFEVGLKPEFDIPALAGKPHLVHYKVAVGDTLLDDELKRIALRYGKSEDKESITAKVDIISATFELDTDGTKALTR